MITKNHQQEVLSRSYVQVIAARCGFISSTANLDYGVDLSIHDVMKLGQGYCESGFKIDAQLKSCIAPVVTALEVRYDLEIASYHKLIIPNPGTPRILILLVMPNNETEWTAQSEDSLEVRRCAYWISLEGMPSSKNKRTVQVIIPRANVFSIDGLVQLMGRVRRREKL